MPSTKLQAMPSTWNRNVRANGDSLEIFVTGVNPPPPAAPDGEERDDTADTITVYRVDRGGRGARINYHAPGNDVRLTGIALKPGSEYGGGNIEVEVNGPGTLMTLRITKDSDAPSFTGPEENLEWKYYVQSTVNGVVTQTPDPMIHNKA